MVVITDGMRKLAVSGVVVSVVGFIDVGALSIGSLGVVDSMGAK